MRLFCSRMLPAVGLPNFECTATSLCLWTKVRHAVFILRLGPTKCGDAAWRIPGRPNPGRIALLLAARASFFLAATKAEWSRRPGAQLHAEGLRVTRKAESGFKTLAGRSANSDPEIGGNA